MTETGKKAWRLLVALVKAALLLAMGTLVLRGIELALLDRNAGAWVEALFGYLYIALFGAVIGYAVQAFAKGASRGRPE